MQGILLRRSFVLLTQGNLKSRRCCVVNVIEVQSTSHLSRFVVCLASQWVTLGHIIYCVSLARVLVTACFSARALVVAARRSASTYSGFASAPFPIDLGSASLCNTKSSALAKSFPPLNISFAAVSSLGRCIAGYAREEPLPLICVFLHA
jgi:hypothetical protein